MTPERQQLPLRKTLRQESKGIPHKHVRKIEAIRRPIVMKTRLEQQIELIKQLNKLHGQGLAHQTKALRDWLHANGYEDKVEPVVIPEPVYDTLHRALMADPNMSDREIRDIMRGGPDDNPALEALRRKLQGVADGGKIMQQRDTRGQCEAVNEAGVQCIMIKNVRHHHRFRRQS